MADPHNILYVKIRFSKLGSGRILIIGGSIDELNREVLRWYVKIGLKQCEV